MARIADLNWQHRAYVRRYGFERHVPENRPAALAVDVGRARVAIISTARRANRSATNLPIAKSRTAAKSACMIF